MWNYTTLATVWQFPEKLNVHLPHDPAIPFLPIYPREIKACVHIYKVFIKPLLVMAKIWNPHVHQQVNKQNVKQPCSGMPLSNKKESTTDTQNNMDESPKQVSWVIVVSHKKKDILWFHLYKSLRNTNESTVTENTWGRGWGRQRRSHTSIKLLKKQTNKKTHQEKQSKSGSHSLNLQSQKLMWWLIEDPRNAAA